MTQPAPENTPDVEPKSRSEHIEEAEEVIEEARQHLREMDERETDRLRRRMGEATTGDLDGEEE